MLRESARYVVRHASNAVEAVPLGALLVLAARATNRCANWCALGALVGTVSVAPDEVTFSLPDVFVGVPVLGLLVLARH